MEDFGRPGTNFFGKLDANVNISQTNEKGFATKADCIGNPNVVALHKNVYNTGCEMIRNDILTGDNLYHMTGTTVSPSWTLDSSSDFQNPMTTVGDIIYEDATPAPARLPGNSTTTLKVLAEIGDGTTPGLPFWDILPLGGQNVYYLHNTSASVATYLQQLTAPQIAKVTLATTGVNTTRVLYNFITNPGVPGITFIPAGQYTLHIHADSTNPASVNLYAEIWEVSATGVDIAKIGTTESTATMGGLNTTETEYNLSFSKGNVYNLASLTSRIDTRIFALRTSNTHNINIYVGGEADSSTILPSNLVPVTSGIVDVTYQSLVSLIGSSSLTPGTYYRITDYVTRDFIYGTSTSFSGSTEPLLVFATTNNTISNHALSEHFPMDKIEYSYTNNTYGANSRPGLITYREDTLNDISAFYDWRQYQFQRFPLTPHVYDWSGSTTYTAPSLVTYLNVFYLCVHDIITPGTSPDTDFENWLKLVDFTANSQIFPLSFSIAGITLNVNASAPATYKTFPVSSSPISIHLGLGTSDIVFIGGATYADIGATSPTNTFVENIQFLKIGNSSQNNVCAGGSNEIKIGDNSSNNWIGNVSQYISMGDVCVNNIISEGVLIVDIGNQCYNNYILSRAGKITFDEGANTNVIGDSSSNCIIGSNSFSNSIYPTSQYIDLGRDCYSNIVKSSYYVNIGDKSFNNSVGDTCEYINIGKNSSSNEIDDSCIDIIIKEYCNGNHINSACDNVLINKESTDNSINYSCTKITLGIRNGNNALSHGNSNIVLGNNCFFTSIANDGGDIKFGNDCKFNNIGRNAQYVTMGDNCYLNTLGDSMETVTFGSSCNMNAIGDTSQNLRFGDGCSLNNIFYAQVVTFSDYCGGNTFTNTMQYCNFSGFVEGMSCPVAVLDLDFEMGVYDYTGIDFSSATIIPGGFCKTAFFNQSGFHRLRYFSPSDVLTVSAVNA